MGAALAALEPGQLAITRCMLCGGAAARTLVTDPPYMLLRCDACGLVWTTPRLADLRAVYDEGYWRSDAPRQRGYGDYRGDERLYLKTFRRRFEVMRRHLPERAVLDVGCAAGFSWR